MNNLSASHEQLCAGFPHVPREKPGMLEKSWKISAKSSKFLANQRQIAELWDVFDCVRSCISVMYEVVGCYQVEIELPTLLFLPSVAVLLS